jgi:dipeptidyl aminopeptidase/acylaminoacyl peptidase
MCFDKGDRSEKGMKKWRFGVLIILIVFVSIVLPVSSVQNGKIAFFSDNEICVMNADGTGQTCITNNQDWDNQPAWSLDGTKIAFTSDRDGNREIYVMNADGTGQTCITNNPANDADPAWSPDGTKIAFTSGRSGNGEIYVMNADGTGQSDFTNCLESMGICSQPTWSPDGSKIAYIWHFGLESNFIHTLNTDGTGETVIFTNGHAEDPAWSPDGTKIVYVSEEWQLGTWYEIFVTNVDGSGWIQLTTDMTTHRSPNWGRVPNQPPVANAGQDQTVIVNEIATFDGSGSTDSDGTLETYAWDFGDTSIGSGMTTSHAYTVAGTYTVTLTVTDNEGLTGSDTTVITVQTPAEAVQDLITKVDGLGLPKGIEQSLLAKLDTAEKKITQEQYTPARNTLNAFINQVNAQRGKAITETQADELILIAQRIINSIPGK